jgi:hypothetical protein
MKEEIENLVKHNGKLLEFFNTPSRIANTELLNLVIASPTFTSKLKDSLDYYKPRDPTKAISDSFLFYKKPIQPCIRDILFEFSNEYVHLFKIESLLRTSKRTC